MSVSRVAGGAELLAEAFVERVDVDVFDGREPAVLAIELAPSLRVSDVDPIGGAVTGAPKTSSLNKLGISFGGQGAVTMPVTAWQSHVGT